MSHLPHTGPEAAAFVGMVAKHLQPKSKRETFALVVAVVSIVGGAVPMWAAATSYGGTTEKVRANGARLAAHVETEKQTEAHRAAEMSALREITVRLSTLAEVMDQRVARLERRKR